MIDLDILKENVSKILSPIKPIDEKTTAQQNFLFNAKRSKSSGLLPEYYLIYFLFIDLLEYKNLGQFEKIAWSIPIDYNGKAYLIEHRKFGVGVFLQDPETDEIDALKIITKINGAIKKARPYYNFIAEKAVEKSELNVKNKNDKLFNRFNFLLDQYKTEYKKYLKNKGKTKKKTSKDGTSWTVSDLSFEHYQKANWFAISCIEAFFSWTEHLFVHLAIIGKSIDNGEIIAKLISAEWKVKFKTALPLVSKDTTNFYNELIIVRTQLRNFVAHGAFGKDGNAFLFHSGAGSVPVMMNLKKKKNKFSLQGELVFNEQNVIDLIEKFIKYLWKSPISPAMIYTQKYNLPTILTFAKNGLYEKAMKNTNEMEKFTDSLIREIDDNANMDF